MIDNFIDKKTEKYLLDKLKDLDNNNFHDDMEIEYILYNKLKNEFKVLRSNGY